MPPPRPGRATRRERRERLRQRLVRALAEHDVTQRDAADAAGSSPTAIAKCCDRESDYHIPAGDIPAYPHPVALDLVRELLAMSNELHGGPEYAVVAVPEAGSTGAAYQVLARVTRENAEAIAATCEGLADGILTPQEADKIIREANQAVGALLSLRELARAKRG